ncbi:hypothetical protein [Scytonema sp. NUACC21]
MYLRLTLVVQPISCNLASLVYQSLKPFFPVYPNWDFVITWDGKTGQNGKHNGNY